MTEKTARKMLRLACEKLYDRKLTVSAGGNMSMRLEDGTIIITPSGRNKGVLEWDDMVKVTMDGEVIGSGRPSMEVNFHIALYKANENVNAVIHCHPPFCTALCIKGEEIRSDLTPEGVLLLRHVPMIGYFTPGTKELAEEVAKHASSMAILMERHGAITQGRNLEEAYNRMEELEFQARLQFIVGKDVEGLPKEEIDRILGA